MKKIFPKETIADVYDHNIDDDIKYLHSDHDFLRSKTAMLIGNRINEYYDEYSKLLLHEMNEPIHFTHIRFGIKSAWTIAIILAENLKPSDYSKLKAAFSQWSEEEKQEILQWLRNHPDHYRILSGTK
ncbi:MAG: hypothetical protein JNM88_04190 [Chitinophagaceae bacterium]|nr:hypothetical protein [Chitinophagaceae bacterium]